MSFDLVPIAPEMSEEMVRQTLTTRVRAFERNIKSIADAMEVIIRSAEALDHVFLNKSYARNFDVSFYFGGQTHHPKYSETVVDEMAKHHERQAWAATIDEIQLWNVMGIADAGKLKKLLSEGQLPEFTVDNVFSVVMNLGKNATNFAQNAAKEVFEFLTRCRRDKKTNSRFRVGKRVIIGCGVHSTFNKGFAVNHYTEPSIKAMDGVFHVLDGKGPMKTNRGPLVEAINGGAPSGETEYFRFKCFRNNNLHIEFLRLDLVQELNYVATGERVLGHDE